MAIRKRGLWVYAWRPDSITNMGNMEMTERDEDGQKMFVQMEAMSGETEVQAQIRHGMSPTVAARTLRKIADMIERHGADLLNRQACSNRETTFTLAPHWPNQAPHPLLVASFVMPHV